MAIKLIKACKELNIGMSTAVEFAAKQGKEIAADPNIRIDDELYLLLAKAFNRDMALKLEAEKQAQERLEREIPKTVSVEPTPEPELLHPVQKPKVLGKIDLQTGKKIEEKPKEEPTPEPKPEVKKEEPKPEVKTEEVKAEQPNVVVEDKVKVEDKVEVEVKDKDKDKVEAAQKPKEEAKKADAPKSAEHEAPKADAPKPAPAQQPKSEEPEVFSLVKPKLAKTPVVVGKIDLSSINQATHPRQKTKEEKKAEREERKQAEAQRKQAAKRKGGCQ